MGGDAGGKGRHSGAARAARLVKHPLLLANALALMAPAALLAGAYGFQYFAGLPPCEMCLWQRYPHFVAVALALAAALIAAAAARAWLIRLAAVAIAVSGLIGIYHAGVELKWWQGVTACTAAPVTGSTADVLRSEEHTSELQSLMRISYAVFCLKK